MLRAAPVLSRDLGATRSIAIRATNLELEVLEVVDAFRDADIVRLIGARVLHGAGSTNGPV